MNNRLARRPVAACALLVASTVTPAIGQVNYKQPTSCEREKLFDAAILLSGAWKSMGSMPISSLVGGGGMMTCP